MQKKLMSAITVLAVTLTISAVHPQFAHTQNENPGTVSMVSLQTLPGRNGQQMVVTPKGKVVPLPGPGVNGNLVNVYLGSQGGAWYTDKDGQQIDLSGAISAYQNSMQTTQVPQYAPAPVTNNYYDQGNSGSSGGSSAVGTAMAAGLGAATGAALTNSLMQPNYPYYHGVPYGTPMYYGNGAKPYYQNKQGNNVYVGNNDVNVNHVNANSYTANTANVNKVNANSYTANTANVNRVNANSYNANSANVNKVNANSFTGNSAEMNQMHANSLQQQQGWYNQQVSNKSGSNYKNWQGQQQQDNPFVHQDAQNPWGSRNASADGGNAANAANRSGDKAGAEAGGGRFGNRGGDGAAGADGGGRFGNRSGDGAAGADGGGRFGNRGGGGAAAAEGGGGRFAGRAGRGGGRRR